MTLTIIEPIGGMYAGFTDLEWRAYAEGRYQMAVPPVPTFTWTDESWMAWIFGPRPAPRAADVLVDIYLADAIQRLHVKKGDAR